MQRDDIINQVKKVLTTWLFLDLDPQGIADDDDLIEKYGIDSFTVLEVVLGIEEHFDISLESVDIKLDQLRTPQHVTDLIEPLLRSL